MGRENTFGVIRFLLRSPLLWIGIFVSLCLSWPWIQSEGTHMAHGAPVDAAALTGDVS